MVSGVVYRKVELLHSPEPMLQLLILKALREDFISLVHQGIAGHLGAAKTCAHVGWRAYWFRWRIDVDVHCWNYHGGSGGKMGV